MGLVELILLFNCGGDKIKSNTVYLSGRAVDVTVAASCPPGHLLSLQEPGDKGMTFLPVLHPPNHQPVKAWPHWKQQYSTSNLKGWDKTKENIQMFLFCRFWSVLLFLQ